MYSFGDDLNEARLAEELAEKHTAAGYAQSTLSLEMWVSLAEELGDTDLADRPTALSKQ